MPSLRSSKLEFDIYRYIGIGYENIQTNTDISVWYQYCIKKSVSYRYTNIPKISHTEQIPISQIYPIPNRTLLKATPVGRLLALGPHLGCEAINVCIFNGVVVFNTKLYWKSVYILNILQHWRTPGTSYLKFFLQVNLLLQNLFKIENLPRRTSS